MLHVEPGGVHADRAAAGVRTPIVELLPRLRAVGLSGVSPNGVLGDPAGASADEGRQLLDTLVARLVAAARTWSVGPAGRLAG
jgi:mycofactocin precursor peptide peptidase